MRLAMLATALICLPALVTAQDAAGGSVETLAQHLSARFTHGIGETALDSELIGDPVNAAILVSARQGATAANLAKFSVTADDYSQRLAALEQAGLIRRSGDRVRTTFPILIGEDRERYGRLVSVAAAEIYDQLVPHVRSLLRHLEQRGWGDWGFHFVWSQVFDSQFIWGDAIERGLAPELTPAIGWVIDPPHPFQAGTNIYPDDQLRDPVLAVTWTRGGANTTGRIGGQWRAVYDAAVSGSPVEGHARVSLQEIGLLDEGGRVRVPVVRRGDAFHRHLQTLARTYLDLQSRLPLDELAALMDVDRKFAWAMAYHDLAWELLRQMESRGELNRPASLRPQSSTVEMPSMVGVCAIVPTYGPFVAQIEKAISNNP